MFGYMRYVLIVVALLAAGFLAACGSDDDGDNGDSDGNGVEQPVDGDDADGDDADDDSDNDGDGDGDGDTDDDSDVDLSDDLRDLAAQFGITEVKVTYAMSGPGVSGPDSQMVLYSKPPDQWRMDMSTPDGDITMISNGSSTLICTALDGEGGCFESPLDDTVGVPFLNIFTDPGEFESLVDSALDVDVSRTSREIAGEDATCFSFSGDLDGTQGAGEYCFRDDGVLLLLQVDEFEGDEDFSLVAIEVSDSVSDSDLEAPYEVIDLGDLVP